MEKLELRDYQIIGRDYTVNWKYCINGDNMGLGKTIQTIAAFGEAIKNGYNKPILIVAEGSVLYFWQEQIEKWIGHKAVVIEKSMVDYIPAIFNTGIATCFLTTYGCLHYLFDYIPADKEFSIKDVVPKKITLEFGWIVYDESQRLNTITTKQYKLATALNKPKKVNEITYKPDYITFLTGTIFTNSIADVFYQLYCLNREHYFCIGNTLMEKEADFIKRWSGNETELGKRLRKGVYFRRDKVLQLPPKTRQILRVKMDSESQKEYNTAKYDLETYLKEYLSKNDREIRRTMRCEILVKFQYLRQITAKGKIDACLELTKSINGGGNKCVTYAINRDITERLIDELKCPYIIGGLSDKTKQQNINLFQKNDNILNFVASIQAASNGITLNSANYMIILQMWSNPSRNDQTEKRIHRFGTTKPCFVYYPIAMDTIDEKIYLSSENRRKISDTLNFEKTNDWDVIDKIINSDNLSENDFDSLINILKNNI